MTELTPTDIGRGYDDLADLLDQVWGVNLHHGYWESGVSELDDATNRLTDKLSAMVTINVGDRLLDLGCGIGEPAIRLATRHDIEVVGVSISARQVQRANERAARAGLADRMSFQFADAMDLPFPDESFDLVWALESMHHMPDRWHVLRQTARVLRPGGRIAIGDFVLVPGADGQRPDAERVREASKGVLTVVDISEYLARINEVGLVPTSTVDVSRYTRPSWDKAATRFEALRAQAEPHIGAEQFDLTMSRFHSFSAELTLGYALLSARKPS